MPPAEQFANMFNLPKVVSISLNWTKLAKMHLRAINLEQRAGLKRPPKTADEFLDILLKQGLTQTVSILKHWKVTF